MRNLGEAARPVVRCEPAELLRTVGLSFDRSPVPGCPLPGGARLSSRERDALQAIQASVRAGSLADVDLSCLLAYFGVEYQRNARRVLRGYTMRGGHATKPRGQIAAGRALEVLFRVPGHAARLYHRWRDPSLLEWLLSRRRAAGHAGRAENEALLALWDDHWVEILRAADKGAVLRVADALTYACPLTPEPLVWNAYLCHLRQAAGSHDAILCDVAHRILAVLKRRGYTG